MKNHLIFVILLASLLPASSSAARSFIGGVFSALSSINPFGDDYAPNFPEPTDPKEPSIFITHPDVMKELRSLGTGESLTSDIKHSRITTDLSASFLLALDASKTSLRRHAVDYQFYLLSLVTKKLMHNSWTGIATFNHRRYLVYNYEADVFQEFRKQVLKTAEAAAEELTSEPLRKVYLEIVERLEFVSLALDHYFQQKKGYYGETTTYYQKGDTAVDDNKLSSNARELYDAFTNCNRVINMHLDLKVDDVYQQKFGQKLVGLMIHLKTALIASHWVALAPFGQGLAAKVVAFLSSGARDNTLLYGTLDVFSKAHYDTLVGFLKKRENGLNLVGAGDDVGDYVRNILGVSKEVAAVLADTFEPYKSKWVRYRSELKLAPSSQHRRQADYLLQILDETESTASFFYRSAPSRLQIALKTLHSREFDLLNHEVQPDDALDKLVGFHDLSRDFLSGGVKIEASDQTGRSKVVAVEFPIRLCQDLKSQLTNLLTIGFVQGMSSATSVTSKDDQAMILNSVRGLRELVADDLEFVGSHCIEVLDNDFDGAAFLRERERERLERAQMGEEDTRGAAMKLDQEKADEELEKERLESERVALEQSEDDSRLGAGPDLGKGELGHNQPSQQPTQETDLDVIRPRIPRSKSMIDLRREPKQAEMEDEGELAQTPSLKKVKRIYLIEVVRCGRCEDDIFVKAGVSGQGKGQNRKLV